MGFRQTRWTWPALATGILWVISPLAAAAPPENPETQPVDSISPASAITPPHPAMAAHHLKATKVPVEQLPAGMRERVRRVMDHPTIFAHGPAEVFRGRPGLHRWLLDHPDRAVHAWRRLGAKCVDIRAQEGGRFSWADGEGTEIHWRTVYEDPCLRVWWAEGSSRPTPLLPAVAMQAVVVLGYGDILDGPNSSLIYQQADLYLHTDSKAAVLVAKLLGASVPRLAEQGISQLEMFFSALVWYFDRHPERAEAMLGSLPPGLLSTSAATPTPSADGKETPPGPAAGAHHHGQIDLP